MTTAFSRGNTGQVGYIDSEKYHKVVQKLRNFFINKGFIECHSQSRLSILAACEDPQSLATYDYVGKSWPLIQTNQMYLELELLERPNVPGYFCTTTSYRFEKNPIPGRHDLVFPMFEVETHGDMDDMINLWRELLTFLGYKTVYQITYEDACAKYGVDVLDHTHEEMMYRDFGPAVLLTHFPMRTSPFWNMKTMTDQQGRTVSKKVDVLLSGVETIGSAERSCDVEDMKRRFYTVSDGTYAGALFNLFGEERVTAELNDFFELPFIQRFGCGMGLTRLVKSMCKEGLI